MTIHAITAAKAPARSTKYPELNDRAWLVRHYIVHRRSLARIAELAGFSCHPATVRSALLRHQIPLRRTSAGARGGYRSP
jgi:hypothetical protein